MNGRSFEEKRNSRRSLSRGISSGYARITGCNGGRTRCLFDLTRPRYGSGSGVNARLKNREASVGVGRV